MNADLLPDRSDIARGRPEAFERLYESFAAPMLRVALSLTGSRADAEDAMQQAFLNLYRSRSAFSQAHSMRAYLYRSVHHAALRIRERPRSAPLEHDTAVTPPEPANEELMQALSKLPIEQREVVGLRIHADMTFEEIGQSLSIPMNTAASRYRYALEKLRTLLGEHS